MSTDMWLVVGLGNPGPKYAGNRHNIGAMILDAMSLEMAGSFVRHKARAQVLDGRLGIGPGGAPGPRVILAKPETYMNVSGAPVAALSTFYSVPPEQILVVHDELDLPEHTLRLKQGGGAGGHNGLKSIAAALGTRDFARLRVGIGRPPGRMDPADYVLANFPPADREEVAVTIVESAQAIEDVVTKGLQVTQNELHSK